jgi:hypothetical protein
MTRKYIISKDLFITMVLAELGQKIGAALKKLNAASVIDDKLL